MQIEIKKTKAEEEFMDRQQDAYKTTRMHSQINIIEMLQFEQDGFLKYAENEIRQYYNEGKDIKPLILDLKSYKKKLFSG